MKKYKAPRGFGGGPELDEDDPNAVEENGVFTRGKSSKSKKPCSGCAKRREAAKAAAKAYAESKPFTVAERIAAARKAFRDTVNKKHGH